MAKLTKALVGLSACGAGASSLPLSQALMLRRPKAMPFAMPSITVVPPRDQGFTLRPGTTTYPRYHHVHGQARILALQLYGEAQPRRWFHC
jgi:hypothetical protein